jgi:hypothetical protein
LQFHLREFVSEEFTYCKSCEKFTKCEDGEFSDARTLCGKCGIGYWRRFERGRRMIDMERPGEKQVRLRKWYNIGLQG